MEEVGVKALVIGVSIFVTLVIVGVVILEITHIGEIYKHVGETNVSFESKFNELDKFNDPNNEFNGLDVKNYINKYREEDAVEVCLESALSCGDMISVDSIIDSDLYKATLDSINSTHRIVFEIK